MPKGGGGIGESGFVIWAWQAICWWMRSVSSLRLALPSACCCCCCALAWLLQFAFHPPYRSGRP
ncbi:hypothetical protein IXO99_10785, partial [Xanthomonas oryzae pv. oryzae]